jgi:predicted Holliday junction resolvase-like endonuclease
METYLIIVILALLAVILVLVLRPRRAEAPQLQELEQKLLYALASQTSVQEIRDGLQKLPHEVLESITSSLGKRTGKLNELMATFELTQYDRLFYLGDPIDFVGIKYDETIDFIEVKTGRFRLTEDEKSLRDLIELKKVNYVPLSVQKIGIAEEVEAGREGLAP